MNLSFRYVPLLAAIFLASCTVPTLAQTPMAALDAQAQTVAADLQKQIDAAIASGQKKLVLVPGIYRVAPPAAHRPHLFIDGAKDLEIVAQGVTLVCTSLDRAIGLRNCQNVSISGLTIDYDPLPFTQGTVLSFAPDGKSCEVKLDAGYRSIEGNGRMTPFMADGSGLKADTWTRYSSRFEAGAQPGTVRVSWPGAFNDAFKVGDKAALIGAQRSPHGIMSEKCSNLLLRDVTLHSSTSFGIFESGGDANRYLNCRVIPGPIPAGATATRLLSTPADGFHSKYAKRGPTVENCLFERMGDDGIAINGDYAALAEVRGNSVFFVPRREVIFQVGDRLRVTKPSGALGTEAKITQINRVATRDGEVKALRAAHYESIRGDEVFNSMWEVQTDVPLTADAGDLLSSPDRNGDGFTLRGNTIRGNRARGILLKSSNGLVENNLIDGSSMGGIVLCPEPTLWMESGFSHDVVIRGNTVRGTGTAASNLDTVQAGAITVTAPQTTGGANSSFAPVGGQRDILIENNVVDGVRGVNLQITSAQGVTVRGNRFLNTHSAPDQTGVRRGVDSSSVVFLSNVRDVNLKDNTVSKLGAHGKVLVKMGAGVEAVQGAADGVKNQ